MAQLLALPCGGPAQRPCRPQGQLLGRRQAAGSAAPRVRGLQCAAQLRAWGGGSSGSPDPAARPAQQPPAAVASQAATVDAAPPLEEQQQELAELLQRLGAAATYGDKTAIVRSLPGVQAFWSGTREGRMVAAELDDLPAKHAYCLACLPAIHQQHVLSLIPTGIPATNALAQLAAALARVEDFYDSLGGLAGYQATCLALLAGQRAGGAPASPTSGASEDWPPGVLAGGGAPDFLVPAGLDLACPEAAAQATAAVAAGLAALPRMAEVYPLGGAGDRLGLRCDVSGEPLPTAVLQYCGRSLLENLVRDVQAREHLYWRLYGRQLTTPIAVMTSAAKGNHWRVEQLFEEAGWFGRGAGAFRLFQQPLVPVLAAADGRWLLEAPLRVVMKPGGHGVMWKLMADAGVFGWLAARGREAAIVRQISNPMAGTDNTLLALAGAGFPSRRAFGFASCERAVGAAEGMNVLAQARSPCGGAWRYAVSNVEYTEFERLGMADASVDEEGTTSVFPANTNVLYVGLPAVEAAVRAGVAAGTTDAVLPGLILNASKAVEWEDPLAGGARRREAAGRLECTMQNLADCLAQEFDAPLAPGEAAAALGTFLVYNVRRKVTSSAKRQLAPGSTRVAQTPDGSFLDLQRNAADLLVGHCGWEVPEVGDVQQYLAHGPGFVFLAHPALGPLWQVIRQKLRPGSLAHRAELQLEVAEAALEGVHVAGSLRVLADAPLGHAELRPTDEESPRAGGGGAPPLNRHTFLDALLREAEGGSSGSAAGGGSGSAAGGGNGSGNGAGGLSASSLSGGLLGSTMRRVGGAAPRPPAGGEQQQQGGYSQPCTFPAADCDPGAALEPRLVYSHRCGRVRLHNVRVVNEGVDWAHPGNVWWRHSLARRQSCQILLHGASEFEARDVTLSGDLTFEVPDGHRMLVTAGADGAPRVQLQRVAAPSWHWRYSMAPDGGVQLALQEGAPPDFAGGDAASGDGSTAPAAT